MKEELFSEWEAGSRNVDLILGKLSSLAIPAVCVISQWHVVSCLIYYSYNCLQTKAWNCRFVF